MSEAQFGYALLLCALMPIPHRLEWYWWAASMITLWGCYVCF